MRIYTRTGDKGETSLGGGKRVAKNDCRIEVLGNLDELNACLGLALTLVRSIEAKKSIPALQNILFNLGAQLVGASAKNFEELSSNKVKKLEGEIDKLSAKLPTLQNFILPGGAKASACLHLARAVCRRAERSLVEAAARLNLGKESPVIAFLNRLSSYLFVLARWENKKSKRKDKTWRKFP